MKPKIYIIHPFASNPSANIERVKKICRRLMHEYDPIAAHLALTYINEDTERDIALEKGISLLSICDEAWICSDEMSEGMKEEILYASKNKIMIRGKAAMFRDIPETESILKDISGKNAFTDLWKEAILL